MIVTIDAHSAYEAVELRRTNGIAALWAAGKLNLHQISLSFFRVLPGQQSKENQNNEVVDSGYCIVGYIGVLAEEVHFDQQMCGKEENVEEHQEQNALLDGGLLYLIYYLEVASDLHPIAVGMLILQHIHQIAPIQISGKINGPLLLQVAKLSVDSLQQHSLHDLFVATAYCVHKRCPSLEVTCIDIHSFVSEQIGCKICKAMFGRLMEDSITEMIDIVGIVGRSTIAVLKQVYHRLQVVILGAHKDRGFLFVGLRHHVGSVMLQKLQHVNVAMESCKVQCGKSIRVGMVDPGAKLSFKCRAMFIASVVCLIMLDINAQFRQFVLECCVMDECGLVLLTHDGEIELGTLFKVRAQILVGLDAHDQRDGLGLGRLVLLPVAHVGLIMNDIQSNGLKETSKAQTDSYSCSRMAYMGNGILFHVEELPEWTV